MKKIKYTRENLNKYGVPYHRYLLRLANGETIEADIGYEEDWGNIQPCVPDDCEDWETSVGWGNDLDGHVKIMMVVDMEMHNYLNVKRWVEYVWGFVKNYSEGGL